jgi:hypothetical protein
MQEPFIGAIATPHPHIITATELGVSIENKRHIFDFKAAENRTERTNTPELYRKRVRR